MAATSTRRPSSRPLLVWPASSLSACGCLHSPCPASTTPPGDTLVAWFCHVPSTGQTHSVSIGKRCVVRCTYLVDNSRACYPVSTLVEPSTNNPQHHGLPQLVHHLQGNGFCKNKRASQPACVACSSDNVPSVASHSPPAQFAGSSHSGRTPRANTHMLSSRDAGNRAAPRVSEPLSTWTSLMVRPSQNTALAAHGGDVRRKPRRGTQPHTRAQPHRGTHTWAGERHPMLARSQALTRRPRPVQGHHGTSPRLCVHATPTGSNGVPAGVRSPRSCSRIPHAGSCHAA